MNFEIWRAIRKHKEVEELYLLSITLLNEHGLVGHTWFLFEDEDQATFVIESANDQYESVYDTFKVIEESKDGRYVKVSYSADHEITITYKIRRVK